VADDARGKVLRQGEVKGEVRRAGQGWKTAAERHSMRLDGRWRCCRATPVRRGFFVVTREQEAEGKRAEGRARFEGRRRELEGGGAGGDRPLLRARL
jgi:hypothetical protein